MKHQRKAANKQSCIDKHINHCCRQPVPASQQIAKQYQSIRYQEENDIE